MAKKFLIFSVLLLTPFFASAEAVDTDGDGLTDEEEINIYYTFPDKADTDGDGYNDKIEIENGYSPHRAGEWMMHQLDWDKDGLNDILELNFGTDMQIPDSDGDG